MDYTPDLTPVIPHEVSVAANSIGYAIEKEDDVEITLEAAVAAAQRLYDQGLLASPSAV